MPLWQLRDRVLESSESRLPLGQATRTTGNTRIYPLALGGFPDNARNSFHVPFLVLSVYELVPFPPLACENCPPFARLEMSLQPVVPVAGSGPSALNHVVVLPGAPAGLSIMTAVGLRKVQLQPQPCTEAGIIVSSSCLVEWSP